MHDKGLGDVISSFSDYGEFEGILFPRKITVAGDLINAGSIIFDRIHVNIPVDQELFLPS